jgi:flagella basal body P-ring formation protein FlgA
MRLLAKVICLCLVLIPGVSSAQIVSADELVTRWVRSTYHLDSIECEIDILSNPFAATVIGTEQMSFRALTLSEPSGLFTVLAELKNDGVLVKRCQIRLRVKRYAEVIVAADRLKRHDILTGDKLVSKRMEITSLRQQPIGSIEQLDGFRIKRNLSKGKILTTGLIEAVPDIEVGREVSILFSDGLCTITAPGRMLQTGWKGDRVKVKNLASGKVITARVSDSAVVVVGP